MNSLVIAGGILRRMLREKSTIGFVLVVPILVSLLIVSLNPGGSTARPVIAVANTDAGAAGDRLIEYLGRPGSYELKTLPPTAVVEATAAGEVHAGLVIPADFTTALNAGASPAVTVYTQQVNAGGEELQVRLNRLIGDMVTATAQSLEVEPTAQMALVAGIMEEVMQARAGVAVEENQPPGNFIGQLSLGFLIMVLMLFGVNLTGSILEDKQGKTFMRTFSAPLQEYELVLGNLMAYISLGLLQIILALVITTRFFRINWGTSVWNVFLILAVFLVSVLGLCIGITGFVGNQEKFGVVSNLIITPTCLLGGCFIPLEAMPAGMQRLANLFPQRWAIAALQKLSQGDPLRDVSVNLLILLLFGLVFFTFGVKTLIPGVDDL